MSGELEGDSTADGKGSAGDDADKAIKLAVMAVRREVCRVGGGGGGRGRHVAAVSSRT